ncbi:MAG TPA: pyridoxal-phosphate dependent enzyme [Candidatus Limnocylindrales bacterium]
MSAVRPVEPPTDTDLEEAWATVSARLAPTPLVASPLAPDACLKLETMQPTGSFKVRGALAALSRLPSGHHVIVASAGNHGLAVAWAATLFGLRATVVVSEQASPAKIAKLRAQPIELILHGDSDAAEAYAPTLVGLGSSYVSPYNDTLVIAGQATVGRELEAQTSGPLTLVIPVGGGGLLAGAALWARGRGDVTLIGVEACASLAVSTAVAAGRVVPISYGDTLADGLAGNIEAGSATVPLLSGVTFTCVDEAQIRAGMRWLMVNHGVVAEGAGAAAVAAVLAGRVASRSRLVVLVTGRNVTPERYAAAIAEP